MHGQLVSTEKDKHGILSECIDQQFVSIYIKLIQVSYTLLMRSGKNKKLGTEYEVQCSILLLFQIIIPPNKSKFNPKHQIKFWESNRKSYSRNEIQHYSLQIFHNKSFSDEKKTLAVQMWTKYICSQLHVSYELF